MVRLEWQIPSAAEQLLSMLLSYSLKLLNPVSEVLMTLWVIVYLMGLVSWLMGSTFQGKGCFDSDFRPRMKESHFRKDLNLLLLDTVRQYFNLSSGLETQWKAI